MRKVSTIIVVMLLLVSIIPASFAQSSAYSISQDATPDAIIVSSGIPDQMTADSSYNISITLKNSGNVSWSEGDGFRLGAVNNSSGDSAKFGEIRMTILNGTVVLPGDQYTFNFTMTAPNRTGVYNPQYQMVWEDHQWFGQVLNNSTIVVSVIVPANDSVDAASSVPVNETASAEMGVPANETAGVEMGVLAPSAVTAGVNVSISPSSVTCAPGATVAFTATVSGSANTSVTWSIQEGPTGGSIASSGMYTAPGATGMYHVVCTSNADSTANATANVTVSITPPVASFTSNVTSGYAPSTVQFNDTSSGSPTNWSWSFGDGTANSTLQNPVHTYASPGSYNVILTVSNAGGSSTKQVNGYITVTTVAYPVIQFSPSAYVFNESNSTVSVTVTKNPGTCEWSSRVNYTLVNDTALLGVDYTTANGEPTTKLNMITNSDLNGTEGSKPTSWTEFYGFADTYCGVNSSYADGEMKAVRMTNTNVSHSVALLSSPIYVDNVSYTYSAYMQRLSNNTTASYIGLMYYYANGSLIGYDYPVKNGGDVSQTLTRYSAVVNPMAARPGTVYVKAFIIGAFKTSSDVLVMKPMFVPTGTNLSWASDSMVRPIGSLTFAPGESTKTITVKLLNNSRYDPTLYFKLGLSGAVNASIGTNNYATVGIKEATAVPSVQFNASSYTFNETAGTVTITVTKNGSAAVPFSVKYATSNGNATAGVNYQATNGTLNFNTNDTSKSFTVMLLDDNVYSPALYFNVALSIPVNCTIGTPGTSAVWESNTDPIPAAIVSPSVYNVTGNASTMNVTFAISPSSKLNTTVNFSMVNGTAVYGTDYVDSVNLYKNESPGAFANNPWETQTSRLIADATNWTNVSKPNSGAKTWLLMKDGKYNNSTYGANQWEGWQGTYSNRFGHLEVDDKVTVSFWYNATAPNTTGLPTTWSNYMANSTWAAMSSTATAPIVYDGQWHYVNLTVTIKQACDSPILVSGPSWGYVLNKTGSVFINDLRWTKSSGQVVIPAGKTSVNKTIRIMDSGVYNGTKTFYLNITNAQNGTVGTPRNATVNVAYIQNVPTVQFNASSYTFNETAGNVTINVTKTGQTNLNTTVNYTTSIGNATPGVNYNNTSGQLTFLPGDTSKTFTVKLIHDGKYDTQKYFYLNLTGTVNAVYGTNRNTTVYINNTDAAAGNGSVIRFLSPLDDQYSNESVNFTGNVSDPAIANLTVTLNGVDMGMAPVTNGNFSVSLNLTAVNDLTVKEIDSNGVLQSATLLLDGDALPGDYELAIGFNPLNPDSDNVNTTANEGGLGVLDGYKHLNDDGLTVVAKYVYNLNVSRNDTEGDGLTDYFEVMKLGLATDPLKNDTDGDGALDALEDADNDGLINIGEQSKGSDPLTPDTDRDSLTDGFEVNVVYSNPVLVDTDNDGLTDDSEVRLLTNASLSDTNGNGVLDGNETYTVTVHEISTGANVTLTGIGDLTKKFIVSNETSPAFQNNPARVAGVINCNLNGTASNVVVTIPYDPAKVTDPANITLAYFNRTYGTYLGLATTVYLANQTASATVPYQYLTVITVLNRQVVTNITKDSQVPADPRVMYPVSLNTADIQQMTMKWFFDGANYSAGHYLIECYGVYYYQPLPWYAETIQAYDNHAGPGGYYGVYMQYSGQDKPVRDIRVSGNVLEFDHAGGRIGAHTRLMPGSLISDWHGDVLYYLRYVNTTDTDGDGLLDCIEDSGFYDGNYNYYHTNSSNPDTDGDRIPDGIEVKTYDFWMVNGFRYYNLYSNPIKNDTDSDNLTDYQELCEIGTDPYNTDTDVDTWTDGDEVHAVKWPRATDPLNPDTDNDTVIDSIDPDPLDPSNCTLPLEWHAGEFAQGLLLGDVASSDPRHKNGAFEIGQFISQFVCVGNARDLIAQASQGKKGPELLMLAVGCIPGEGTIGTLGKGSLKAAKWLNKVDDVAKRTAYTSGFLKDAKLLDKGIDDTEFARTAWGADARALENAGVSPDALGEMAVHGFNPVDGKVVVDNLKAGGTDPGIINNVLKGESPGEFFADYTKSMEPLSTINSFTKKGSDREIIAEFRGLNDGRIMSVQTHVIKNRECYLNDIASRVGPYDYDNKVKLYMHKYGLSEQAAKDRLYSEGITLESTISDMRKSMHTETDVLGEKAAFNDLMQRTEPGGDLAAVLGVSEGAYKTSPNEIGFDFICIDKNGNYVIIEAKGRTKGPFNKGDLDWDDKLGARQMSDEWIKSRIDKMYEKGLISNDLWLDLKKVANGEDPTRTIKKELDIIQDGPLDGKTASSTLADVTSENLGIMNVHVIKTGGVT